MRVVRCDQHQSLHPPLLAAQVEDEGVSRRGEANGGASPEENGRKSQKIGSAPRIIIHLHYHRITTRVARNAHSSGDILPPPKRVLPQRLAIRRQLIGGVGSAVCVDTAIPRYCLKGRHR